jgi:coenzyme F420-reducing hydrogenase delta subunit
MAPPSLFDFVLSQDIADGVMIAGCAESACYNRLGVAWTQQRIARTRDPYLRTRVPRERVATIWASALDTGRVTKGIAAFSAKIAALPRNQRHSPRATTTPVQSKEDQMPAPAGDAP